MQKSLILLVLFTSFYSAIPIVGASQVKDVPLQKEGSADYFKRSILVISHERIFNSTKLGQELLKVLDQKEDFLRAQAEQIKGEFEAEEQRLTVERSKISQAEFLTLSDDFDRRVELERMNQRNKEREIELEFNQWKRVFYNNYMLPIIEKFMENY